MCNIFITFFLEVKPFRSLSDGGDVWKLDDNERVKLVYVFQNNFYSKASFEFLDVSKDYAQVNSYQLV